MENKKYSLEKGTNIEINSSNIVGKLIKVNGVLKQETNGTTPSPNNRVPISVVGDNINLLPTSKDGWEQGSFNDSTGEPIVNTTKIRTINFIDVTENKKYYVKLNNDNYRLPAIMFYKKDGTFISSLYSIDNSIINKKEYLITIPNECFKIKAVLRRSDSKNITPSEIINIKAKLEKGTVATGYTSYNCGGIDYKVSGKEEYQNQTATIELPENEFMAKIDKYEDYIDSQGVLHKFIVKIVLDGTENYGLIKQDTAKGIYQYRTNINFLSNLNVKASPFNATNVAFSNYFEKIANLNNVAEEGFTLSGNKEICLNTKFSNIETFKTWLTEKYANGTPLEIYYILDIPYTISLLESEYDKMQNVPLYTGYNNIKLSPLNSEFILIYEKEEKENKKYIIEKGTNIEINSSNIVGKLTKVNGVLKQEGTPSPNNHVPISVVGDNANLFDINNPNETTVYINANNTKVFYNDTTGNAKSIYIKVKPNTSYSVTKIGDFTSIATSVNIPTLNEPITNIILKMQGNSTIKTGVNDNYLLVFYKWGKLTDIEKETILKQLKIEKGTVATEYTSYNCGGIDYKVAGKEEYQNQTVTIELPKNEFMAKIGYYSDYTDGQGLLHKFINKIVLDGTETWWTNLTSKWSQKEHIFITPMPGIETNGQGVNAGEVLASSHFKCEKTGTLVDSAINAISYYPSYRNGSILINNQNISTLEDFKAWLAEEYAKGTPVEIYYVLATPYTVPLLESEYDKMQNVPLYTGYNNIKLSPLNSEFELMIEETDDIIITNYGKLLPFGLTIDYNKTQLPLISEAIETTKNITGTDGDLVLDTVYGPTIIEITALTDDYLNPEQKEEKKKEISKFLNSIKNKTKKLIIEQSQKFFDVKYNGLAEANNLPKCVEFVLPLKSPSSYAKSLQTYKKIGEGEFYSKTEEDAGFELTIYGPCVNPSVIINGYEMSLSGEKATLLENQKLVINTSNSTVIHYNKSNVKTNLIAYYSKNFPKIKKGENYVYIYSDLKNEQVEIKWNDLLL